jgi:hypothetical protein
MEIDELRDWVIVIFGIMGIGVTLIFAILLIVLYRKVASILDSVEETVGIVRGTTSMISKSIIEPIAKVQDFVVGIRKAVKAIFEWAKGGTENE